MLVDYVKKSLFFICIIQKTSATFAPALEEND